MAVGFSTLHLGRWNLIFLRYWSGQLQVTPINACSARFQGSRAENLGQVPSACPASPAGAIDAPDWTWESLVELGGRAASGILIAWQPAPAGVREHCRSPKPSPGPSSGTSNIVGGTSLGTPAAERTPPQPAGGRAGWSHLASLSSMRVRSEGIGGYRWCVQGPSPEHRRGNILMRWCDTVAAPSQPRRNPVAGTSSQPCRRSIVGNPVRGNIGNIVGNPGSASERTPPRQMDVPAERTWLALRARGDAFVRHGRSIAASQPCRRSIVGNPVRGNIGNIVGNPGGAPLNAPRHGRSTCRLNAPRQL